MVAVLPLFLLRRRTLLKQLLCDLPNCQVLLFLQDISARSLDLCILELPDPIETSLRRQSPFFTPGQGHVSPGHSSLIGIDSNYLL